MRRPGVVSPEKTRSGTLSADEEGGYPKTAPLAPAADDLPPYDPLVKVSEGRPPRSNRTHN